MGHSWCSSGTESEAEQVEMRGSRHRRPCQQLRILHLIVPADRVGGNTSPPMLGPCMCRCRCGKRKAESEKPHGPRRHVGAGDRQPHPNATGGWWWGSRAVAIGGSCRRHQQMSPLRIAGEVKDVDCVEWPESSLPLHLCWAMGGARPSMPRGRARRRNSTWK